MKIGGEPADGHVLLHHLPLFFWRVEVTGLKGLSIGFRWMTTINFIYRTHTATVCWWWKGIIHSWWSASQLGYSVLDCGKCLESCRSCTWIPSYSWHVCRLWKELICEKTSHLPWDTLSLTCSFILVRDYLKPSCYRQECFIFMSYFVFVKCLNTAGRNICCCGHYLWCQYRSIEPNDLHFNTPFNIFSEHLKYYCQRRTTEV